MMNQHSGTRLQLFRESPNNQPIVMAVWSYGFFAIPAVKFSLEEFFNSSPSFSNENMKGGSSTSLILRATIANALTLAGFSVMSAFYGYYGHASDFFLSGEYGFRFALKYICVIEPVRMLWNLWGPYLLGRK